MSEYTQRYEHVSHKELYQGVTSGDPKQIETLSSQWSSLKDTVEGLGRDLSADLEALNRTWTGDAALKFQERVDLVVGYSGSIAEGMAGMRQALDMMATELRDAKAKAESPEETDDNDKLIGGAVKGFVMGGGVGAVIGGFVGHSQDEAEQEKAHQRMVQVVAKLAEGYDFSAYDRIVVPQKPDDRTPGHTASDLTRLSSGPSVGTPSGGPSSGTFGANPGATATTSGGHHTAPTSGTVGTSHSGTGGPGTVGSVGTVGTTGLVGGVGADDPSGTSLAGAAVPLAPTGPTVGLGGTSVAAASPTLPGGGGNSFFGVPGVGTGSLAGSTGSSAGAGRLGGGLENRSAAGAGRLAGGKGVVADGESRSNGGRGATGNRPAMAGRNGVLGRNGQHGDDESDEHLTWLTEDEMVWGDGRSAAPPVLGTD